MVGSVPVIASCERRRFDRPLLWRCDGSIDALLKDSGLATTMSRQPSTQLGYEIFTAVSSTNPPTTSQEFERER